MSEQYNAPLLPHKHYHFKKACSVLAHLARHGRYDHKLIIKTVIQGGIDATEQLYLLEYYYRCAGLLRTKHNYRPVTVEEEREIMSMHEKAIPLLHIAKKLNRHVSTVFYVVRRCKRRCKNAGSK